MARIRLIDPNTFGSGAEVYSVTFTRRILFGGLEVAMTKGGNVFIWAKSWKGAQPRLILRPREDGHADWLKILEGAAEVNETHRFVGAAEAAANQEDQWLTHGPSSLLA